MISPNKIKFNQLHSNWYKAFSFPHSAHKKSWW